MTMASQDKQSVPKFSSFKAPPKPQVPSSRTDHSESRRHDDRKSRHSSRRREEERSRSPRRSDRRERRGSPVRPIRQRSPRLHDRRNSPDSRRSSKLGSEALRGHEDELRQGKSDGHGSADDPTADLFIVDLKGDRHNLTYGATHRYAVPKYKRWGKGHVLGADQRYRIDRDHLDSDSLVLRIKDSRSSDTSKSIRPLAKRIHQPERLLRLKTEDQPHSNDELDQDFISFDSITDERAAGGDSADERHAYRSIHGKAEEEDDIPQHMELVSDENIHESDVSIERRARHAELSRAVNSNPADVSAWLRLIDHQDILILGPDENSRPLTYNEQQSVADVKLSLYEKAIKQSAASPHKDRLLLGRLQEGAHLWDTKKLLAQWNKTLQENSECIGLWVNYLNVRQTDFQNFDFEQLMATFYECLELNSSSDSRGTKSHVQCYLFLRMTLFLREAGYLELAVGLWQAVLEFTYLKPESQPQESESFDVLTSFRSYWEDESPRIGESGSLTWRGWVDSRIDQVPSYALREYQHDVEISSLMTSWEKAEKEQTLASRLPSRTLDQLKSKHAVNDHEQYVDDAYSVVLFSDLERILKLFRGFDSPDEILDGFLYFCHLPHLTKPRNAQTTRLWSGDNFLENGLLDLLEPGVSQWMEHQTEGGTSVSPLRFPHSNFLHTTGTFFADANDWFDSFASWHQGHESPDSSVVDREWAQMVLRCLLERGNSRETFDDELAEYILGLIFAWDPKKAKKYAKALLKKWTSSLRVCNALALIEWRNNSEDAAVQVWSSTISWSQKLSDDLKVDLGILWNSWTWELLHQGNHARASYILHAIPVQSIDKDVYNQIQSTDSASNPTSTLQVQSYLRDCQTRALAYRKLHSFVAYTDCLALLVFIEKYPLQVAFGVYSSAVSKLNDLPAEDQISRSYITEILHQARAKLLFFHLKTKSTQLKPIEIRHILQESISLFPNNTIFLSLLVWNESRFNVLDRIRNVHLLTNDSEARYSFDSDSALSATALQPVPITTHLLSIWSELCRPTWAGSTHHSTRAAFEKVLYDNSNQNSQRSGGQQLRSSSGMESARSSAMIWKLYIIFETYRARDIGAAKAVFYRAIRACPWSKQLFMLAFQYLQDDVEHQTVPAGSGSTGFLFDDLRQLYQAMTEKQLRIHVNIEDKIQQVIAARRDISEDGLETKSVESNEI